MRALLETLHNRSKQKEQIFERAFGHASPFLCPNLPNLPPFSSLSSLSSRGTKKPKNEIQRPIERQEQNFERASGHTSPFVLKSFVLKSPSDLSPGRERFEVEQLDNFDARAADL